MICRDPYLVVQPLIVHMYQIATARIARAKAPTRTWPYVLIYRTTSSRSSTSKIVVAPAKMRTRAHLVSKVAEPGCLA